MDHQFYRPTPDRHSKHMENLSLIMGIIALSTFCLVYPALICGALGIVFALLSRGGETTFSGRAKLGLTLSSVALGIIVLLLIYSVVFANVYYGGIENMMRESCTSLIIICCFRRTEFFVGDSGDKRWFEGSWVADFAPLFFLSTSSIIKGSHPRRSGRYFLPYN